VFLPLSLPGIVGAGDPRLHLLARLLRHAGILGGGRVLMVAEYIGVQILNRCAGASARCWRRPAGQRAAADGGARRAWSTCAACSGRRDGTARRAPRPVARASLALAWCVVLFLVMPIFVVFRSRSPTSAILSLPAERISLQHFAKLMGSADCSAASATALSSPF
jgi:ribosomal protein L34E